MIILGLSAQASISAVTVGWSRRFVYIYFKYSDMPVENATMSLNFDNRL